MTDSADTTDATANARPGLFIPLGAEATPEINLQGVNCTARRAIEDAVQLLIEQLDALDPDPDLEPYLAGGPAPGYGIEGLDLEDDQDGEPSLGWTLGTDQSGRKFHAGLDDLEDEHDGREPDVDAEPDDPAEDDGTAEESEPGELAAWTREGSEAARAGRGEALELLAKAQRRGVPREFGVVGPDGRVYWAEAL